MLESLHQGAGTIHELNLTGAFPERAPYRPWEVYAALKRTPLFDAERGKWNFCMSGEQELEIRYHEVHAQLFGVLAEMQCNPGAAGVLYEQLKEQLKATPEMLQGPFLYAQARLLAVLVEAQFHPAKAREQYEQLKATPLYDPARWQWNERDGDDKPQNFYRFANSQLLGVLVESQFHPKQAQALYAQLKVTPLYDPERAEWNGWMSERQILLETDRYATAQLLGVLAEAHCNPEGARTSYEKLRASPLSDRERGQWNWRMSENGILLDTNRHAHAQLLGVLVEAKLLATLPRLSAEAVPPLPVVENW